MCMCKCAPAIVCQKVHVRVCVFVVSGRVCVCVPASIYISV